MNLLITGANRGLGLELVKAALKEGFTVLATFRAQAEGLCALREQHPEHLLLYSMDVTSQQSVENASYEIASRIPCVDVIINNAAILPESKYFSGDPVTEVPLAVYEDTLACNVMGPIRVLHYFAPLLYRSKAPLVFNISSEGAMLKPEGYHYPAYSISKYALNMYSQKIKNYFDSPGSPPVQVYMIHPGRMNTVMGQENAQIEPEIPAKGIISMLIHREKLPDFTIPFIDYEGNRMPDFYPEANKEVSL